MEFPTNYFMINNEEQESVSSDWERIRAVVASVREEAAKVIVGQADVVDQMLVSLLCRGHCLIVGVPGLAKTLLVGTLGRILGLDFKRIQFTPDLMPPDILGSEILQTSANGSRAFEYVPGPVFTNLLLADEINRTPPKTQAALLEAMQEKQVTVAGKTRTLAEPFIVYATQNPLEQVSRCRAGSGNPAAHRRPVHAGTGSPAGCGAGDRPAECRHGDSGARSRV